MRTNPAVVRRPDYTLPPGQEIEVEHAEDGFRVSLTRLVKLGDRVVDEYSFTNHYRPARTVVLVGTRWEPPTPAPSPTSEPIPQPIAPSPTPAPAPPQRPTGGQARVPSVVGLPEASARAAIDGAGLANGYTNYQGPGDVPADVLQAVPVGHVLSQSPGPGTPAPVGSRVLIAVRKS